MASEPTDEMVEAAALSDAMFDGRPWDSLGRADKRRYTDRARQSLTAALAVQSRTHVVLPREWVDRAALMYRASEAGLWDDLRAMLASTEDSHEG